MSKHDHLYTLSEGATMAVRAEFYAVLDRAVAPYQVGQQEMFPDEDEAYIRQEVNRMLYEPKLPSAGDQERRWIKKLNEYSADDTLPASTLRALNDTIKGFSELLPRQEYIKRGNGYLKIPGFYYTRKPLTMNSNKGLFKALIEMRSDAIESRDWSRKWLADFLLEGVPEPVANFKLECLYLLRGADGNVVRLVRLVNAQGEVSQGREAGGTDVLPSEAFASAEKFRAWCMTRGNFNWGVGGGAGNLELQMLHSDVSSDAAYRVSNHVQHVGWHALRVAAKTEVQSGSTLAPGLWFFDDCVIANGAVVLPDEDGIYWHEGTGYAMAHRGRESEFAHERPKMRPGTEISQIDFGKPTDWKLDPETTDPKTAFFHEVCSRLYDTAGGYEGWMCIGAMLAYAAAPELFRERNMFPSLWVPGEMGSGKTIFCSWLMSIQGFDLSSGLGVTSKNVTAVGTMCQLENYSNLAVWLDEFRQHEIAPEKTHILRDAYNRQLAAKWSPDGQQRKIFTTPLVSGETTTSDAATRSRYPHCQLSASRRKGNHMDWFQAHRQFFYLFFRECLLRREEFVSLVFLQMDHWMGAPELQAVPERERITHAVSYAAFVAATVLFQSHGLRDVAEFRKFMASHAAAATVDVQADKNVNVFLQDMVTCFNSEALPIEFFTVETELVVHPPGQPNQGQWESLVLYFRPNEAISSVQAWLTKQRGCVTLRQKDLRDQLSRNPYWVTGAPRRYIGPRGAMVQAVVWGIRLDLHPLGYNRVSDEEFQQALSSNRTLAELGSGFTPAFKDGDPRRGPLYAIVDAVRRSRSSQE